MAQGEELRTKIKEVMVDELMLDFDAAEIADQILRRLAAL